MRQEEVCKVCADCKVPFYLDLKFDTCWCCRMEQSHREAQKQRAKIVAMPEPDLGDTWKPARDIA
jgi:hypothetical protein